MKTSRMTSKRTEAEKTDNPILSYSSHIDLLRVIACIMVIIMHAPMPSDCANGLFLSSLSYFTAPCIGLFFMVSGSLLLPVKTDAGTFIKKRLTKVMGPTFFWSIFYITANLIKGDNGHSVMKELLSIPFSAQGNPVLWFMYTLTGLYVLAPIISRWLEAASQKELEFYLIVWAVSLCYPVLSMFLVCNQGTTGILYYFTGYAGYFILGYYLKKYPEQLKIKRVLPAMLVAIAAPIICKVFRIEVNFYEVFWYLSIFVVIQCVFWYQSVMCIGKSRFGLNAKRLLTKVSNLTFGIYLVHIFIMRYLLWNWEFIRSIESYIVQTFIIATLTFVLSALCCHLISRLPKSQYIIGYTNTCIMKR